MEQLDTTRGECVIGEFVQKLPGEASTLEDGLPSWTNSVPKS